MTTLVIECSLPDLRIGVFGTGVSAQRVLPGGRGEALDGMVVDLLQEQGLAIADLQRVVVSTGPGSFTGLRVGIAYAEGLCFVGGVSLHGVTTLAALAAQVEGPVAVVLLARPGFWYVGVRKLGEAPAARLSTEAFLTEAEALAAVADCPVVLGWKANLPAWTGVWKDLASTDLDLSCYQRVAGEPCGSGSLKPNYLQDNYAKAPTP